MKQIKKVYIYLPTMLDYACKVKQNAEKNEKERQIDNFLVVWQYLWITPIKIVQSFSQNGVI